MAMDASLRDRLFASTRSYFQKQSPAVEEFTFGGRRFLGFPGVFYIESKTSGGGRESLLRGLPAGRRLLEVGCGSSCGAIIYILNQPPGTIDYCLLLDNNPAALENTEANLRRHGVTADVRWSDVFSALTPGETFDVIYWAVPYFLPTPADDSGHVDQLTPASLMEAICDPGYKAIQRFLSGAHAYLSPSGRAFIGFSSTCGHFDLLQHLACQTGVRLKVVATSTTPSFLGEIKQELIEIVQDSN